MNGFEYSLSEIDGQLIELIPWLKRRECTPRNMAEVDELLDQRNELMLLMGSATLQFEEVFGGGY
jgi:hypothetical protein